MLPLRYPPKIVPHTTLPTTILLFQNLFSSKINSQSPILPYLRQRSRSTKSKIVPHTTLPTTILPFQNFFSLSNHFYPYHCSTSYNTTYNLLIFIFQYLAHFTSYQYLFHINTYLCGFFFKNLTPRKLFIF